MATQTQSLPGTNEFDQQMVAKNLLLMSEKLQLEKEVERLTAQVERLRKRNRKQSKELVKLQDRITEVEVLNSLLDSRLAEVDRREKELQEDERMLVYYADKRQKAAEEEASLRMVQQIIDSDKEAISGRLKESTQYECEICMESKTDDEIFWLDGCEHDGFTCIDCMTMQCVVKIKDGHSQITCPHPKCSAPVVKDVVLYLLYDIDPALITLYNELLYKKALNDMPDISYCPVKTCSTPCPKKDGELMVTCIACKHEYCFTCRNEWHTDSTCEEYLEWKKKHPGEDVRFLMWKDKHKTKQCPKCRHLCEHAGGCPKMICANCKETFCWKCLAHPIKYDHFGKGSCSL